jgi:Mn2+/Fe2+ NRAMP family transporter
MFSFPLGLSKTFTEATRFYLVLAITILLGVLLNFTHIDPVLMLYYAAAVNGILAAPLLTIILFVANNKKILGEKVNSPLSNILVITTTVLMAIISLFTIESFIR